MKMAHTSEKGLESVLLALILRLILRLNWLQSNLFVKLM